MSVLTVTNTVPDRTFTIHQAPLTNPPNRALPPVPDTVVAEIHSYTRSIAQKTQPGAANTHRHSRTVSSSTLPNPSLAPPVVPASNKRHSYTPPTSYTPPFHARQPSKTSSQIDNMQRQGTTGSNSNASIPRRSTSGRSVATNSPTSYVVLMRKQKATVWCDRAQNIDPRIAQQQKAAKQRAVNEAFGTNYARTASSISSVSVVGKIRHHGPKSGPINQGNMSGVVVPPRLLEFDLLGEENPVAEGRVTGDNSMVHARTGSGKSSINSNTYRSGYRRVHTSPPDGGSPAHEDIPEAGETPGIIEAQKENYFSADSRKPAPAHSDSEEDNFGELKEMTGPSAAQRAQEQQAKLEELRRRGSVDERTTTMTGPAKLYVTNPDD